MTGKTAMIRKQHILFLTGALILVSLIWIPVWHFALGLSSEAENPMTFQLKAYTLTIENEASSTVFSFDGLKPSIWYLNTFGLLIYFGCLLISFLHFNSKGNRQELLVQRRWGYLSLAGGAMVFLFLFLQIHQILRQMNVVLGASAQYVGRTANGDLFLDSLPDTLGLSLTGVSLLLNLAAIWFIQSDLRKIASSSRLR
ncbi:MAG: hypothetical protein L6Q77_00155 [Bacteroidetes bacterium]|nr:hypothetical protein [Bacteroidota bacterium]